MKKSIIVAIIAMLLTGALMVGFMQYIKSQAEKPVEEQIQQVYVAATDIPANTEITEEMLTSQALPVSSIISTSTNNKNDIIGKYCAAPIPLGQQISTQSLLNKENNLAMNVEQGKRAITLSVTETSGLAYGLTDGDSVDIYATMTLPLTPEEQAAGKQEQAETFLLAENKTILKVGTYADAKPEDGTTASYGDITILVEVDEVPKIIEASANGQLTLALRNTEDNTTIPYASVSLDMMA